MRGLMMDVPLMISSILKHGARFHHDVEIVSRTVEGPIHRYTYADLERRSKRLANALGALGVRAGDRVGTLAWNTYRHVELYYGVAGIGAVCHTINPRLHPDQIAYIVNHAQDEILFIDLTFVPLVEALRDRFPHVRRFVILTAEATMPQTSLPGALCYETLLAAEPDEFDWPAFDENTASGLCYTSGTTGQPKGALYSHRSTVLHAMTGCMAEMSWMPESRISVMPIVPMFHVTAWGFPFAAPMMGAKLVLPGPLHDPASLYELLENERVRRAGAVPTVWLSLLDYLERTGKSLTWLQIDARRRIVRARLARAAFEARGIEVTNGWGMTEMSPVGTTGTVKAKHLESPERSRYQSDARSLPLQRRHARRRRCGHRTARRRRSQGELQVRGPVGGVGILRRRRGERERVHGRRLVSTGDIVTIDPDGYMSLRDRSKDLIKSGGEWISSIDLENAAIAHPEIAEAAAIGVPHPKWSERPVLCVVRRPGSTLDRDGVLAFLDGKIAKWWMPDDVPSSTSLPHTATGKVSKRELRATYAANAR
jgi:acyl-CoA synthetase (AMP-forming)/AMP-acid ligase II